jgi:hypothetical protein
MRCRPGACPRLVALHHKRPFLTPTGPALFALAAHQQDRLALALALSLSDSPQKATTSLGCRRAVRELTGCLVATDDSGGVRRIWLSASTVRAESTSRTEGLIQISRRCQRGDGGWRLSSDRSALTRSDALSLDALIGCLRCNNGTPNHCLFAKPSFSL